MPALPLRSRSVPLTGTLAAFAVLVAWDASGLDLALARVFGDAGGFPWRHHWLFDQALHQQGRLVSWLLAVLLCIGVWRPIGPLRRLAPSARCRLAVSTLLAAFAVSLLKFASPVSCPWDLQEFGGVAHYVSHWRLSPDGGSGHCFPAGHASGGFAFLGGYFAFRRSRPAIARHWLAGSLALGLLFGLAQQVRGAHFMSHTLWTAWICWSIAALVHTPRSRP